MGGRVMVVVMVALHEHEPHGPLGGGGRGPPGGTSCVEWDVSGSEQTSEGATWPFVEL